ncbi:MAG TPA: protein kinase [Pirellulaceae bacterium]|nr:protein kinase [Pirellulaceae bacterium]
MANLGDDQRFLDPNSTIPPEDASSPDALWLADARRNLQQPPAGGLRYRVVRQLARGGLGKVSIADDMELGRTVALKELLDQHADDGDTQSRFLTEAKITGSLEHPGVVPVYGLGSYIDGRPYYAMRFIQGTSLEAAVDQFHRGPASPAGQHLELRKLLGRFIAVCNAMEYAHSRRVIHRDLKPANIMLGQYGETLVVDWGLAKLLDGSSEQQQSGADTHKSAHGLVSESNQTLMGSIVGTPHFMSPEQAAGRIDQVGPASDLYSLGATLFYLLTGQTPVEGTSLHEVLQNVKSGAIRHSCDAAMNVPKPLRAICRRAMALRPEDRYGTALAIADDIEHWLADEPVSVHQESWSDRITRWTRRHRTWFQAVSASFLAIIGVLVLAIVLINGQRRQAELERGRAAGLALEKTELAEQQRLLRRQAEWQAANRSLEQSLMLCAQDPAAGLLALVDNLDEVQRIEAADLEESIRAQLARWSGEVHALESVNVLAEGIHGIAVHPDGQRMLICVRGAPGQWFDMTRGEKTGQSILHEGGILRAAFNRDGTVLATAGADHTVRLWNVATSLPVGSALEHEHEIVSVSFGGDEKDEKLLTASGKSVRIWDVANQQPTGPKIELDADLSVALFSPVDSLIFTADWSGSVCVYDAKTGERQAQPWIHSGPVFSLSINPQGTIVAAGEVGSRAILWEVASGKPIGPPLVHQGMVACVGFSPDGSLLLTGSGDQSLRIWNVASGRQIGSEMRHHSLVSSAKFSTDGSVVWTGGATMLRSWRVADGHSKRLALGTNGNLVAASFSPDGETVLTVAGTLAVESFELPGELCLWRTSDAQQIGESRQNALWGEVAAISHDGNSLCATRTNDSRRAQIWDLRTQAQVGETIVHDLPIKALRFSQDDRWIASGSEDKTARLWNANTGEAFGQPLQHDGRVADMEFLTRGVVDAGVTRGDGLSILTGSWDQSARMWSVSGEPRVLWRQEHPGVVTAVAVRPDGAVIATGASDGAVRLWEANTGDQLGGVIKHDARVTTIKFCDAHRLLVGTTDGKSTLWDQRLRLRIGSPMVQSKDVTVTALTSDGSWVLTASADWSARLWRIGPWRDDLASIKSHCRRLTNLRRMVDRTLVPLTPEEWIAGGH